MKYSRVLVFAGAVAATGLILKNLLQSDIQRYNRLATMSGDKPLFEDQISKIKDLVGAGGRNGSA